MDNIVNLEQERDRRDGPEPACRCDDQYGRRMFLFSFHYRHDNRDWSFEIWAYDQQDAEARITSIKETVEYSGQVYSIIPA